MVEKTQMVDKISVGALEWALTHVSKYNDTDVFPRAFEIDCIKANWTLVREVLSVADFGAYSPETPFRIIVPKANLGFRVALQPGPLESILYAASVYEMAPSVESHRLATSSKVACSFRVDLRPDGSLFGESDGAVDFHERSKELANSGSYSFVLLVDIADFYNQIYTHRVQSALEAANVDKQRASNFEDFILLLYR
jgi:hypothetical protein